MASKISSKRARSDANDRWFIVQSTVPSRHCCAVAESVPPPPRTRLSVRGLEDNRIRDRHDTVFRRRKAQRGKRSDDTGYDGSIRQVGSRVARVRHVAARIDDELHEHAPAELRVLRQTTLVTQAKAAKMRAHDALNHFR